MGDTQSYNYSIIVKDDTKITFGSEWHHLPPQFLQSMHFQGENTNKSTFKLSFRHCGGLDTLRQDPEFIKQGYLNTGDSGTERLRARARRGTRGHSVDICHQRRLRPRLMIRTLPTHLKHEFSVWC